MPLQIPNALEIQNESPRTYEALVQIASAINQGHSVAGIDPTGVKGAPSNTGIMDVSQVNGIYDVTITDPNPQRLAEYYIEWDTQPSFATARLVQHGVSRYYRATLGNLGTTYWRYYKQFQGSNVSGYINHGGTTPLAVGGGGTAGPTPGGANGSGSSLQPGQGFGPIGKIQPHP